MYKNKVLLVTGGTGSFGNMVVKHFINTEIKEIIIFSRDEKKQDEMRNKYSNDKLKFIIGDIRDLQSISEATMGVDFIFHAAALKQVPSCEFYPLEAVKTNILGAENVLHAAYMNGVQKIVVLSTDKAVLPINAMGISKAMMEKLMVGKARRNNTGNTIFCATRYGNVMGSRGSVIPLFIDQILSGGDITITDPEMTRFMMSLPESVDLVKFAFDHANNGDIFVHKAPAATVLNVAMALKHIFNADNNIRIIGARHGEKKYETLCNGEEMSKADDMGGFYRVPMDSRGLNYTEKLESDLQKSVMKNEYNSDNTKQLNLEDTIELLLTLDIVKENMKRIKS